MVSRRASSLVSVCALCVLLSRSLFPEDLAECLEKAPLVLSLLARGAEGGAGGRYLDVDLSPGEPFELELFAGLENLTREPHEVYTCGGFFGMSVAHDTSVLEILEATVEGTDYARLPAPGFPVVQVAQPRNPGEPAPGFVAAELLCFAGGGPVVIESSLTLVRARYRLRAPFGDELTGQSFVTSIRFEDGLRGRGQPVMNLVVVADGRTRQPCLRGLEVRFHVRGSAELLRGDANRDWRLDISDAVTILRTLFEYGDAPIRCSDAADVNDDGKLDISDAIAIFSYLFQGGRAPAAPFPRPGFDPTADALGCAEPSG